MGDPVTDPPSGTASPWSHPHRRPGPDRPRPRAIPQHLRYRRTRRVGGNRRMFMTTDAWVSSSWLTFEPLSASPSCSGQPHRQGAPPLEQDVAADEYADFTKEYRLHHGRITLP